MAPRNKNRRAASALIAISIRGVRRHDTPSDSLDQVTAVPLTGVYHNLMHRWAEV